jgi:putative flippase GtrA
VSLQFLLFAGVGGFAALVNIASRLVFEIAVPFEAAIVLAYLMGMTTAFLLNRAFVFAGGGGDARAQYARFALVNVVALAQVWLVTIALARYLFPGIGMTWRPDTAAHVIGVLSPIVTSYFGHKHFSFRQ